MPSLFVKPSTHCGRRGRPRMLLAATAFTLAHRDTYTHNGSALLSASTSASTRECATVNTDHCEEAGQRP